MDNEEESLDFVCDTLVNRYLNEPMLCRESGGGRVPHVLQSLYETTNVQCPADAVIVVLHVLMLEAGYTLRNSISQSDDSATLQDDSLGGSTAIPECLQGVTTLPADWKNGDVYTIHYSHGQFLDEKLCLMCTMLGQDTLVVHGLITGEHRCKKSLNIQCSEFVKDIKSSPGDVYCNLPKLSCLFKDNVASPLMAHIKQVMNIEDDQGLSGMIYEIKLRILHYLDVGSLLKMAEVSKEMNHVCNDKWVWRHLYLNDFGRRSNQGLHQDWKQLYKETYQRRKELRRRRHMQYVVPPYISPPQAPFPFTPTYPPGFIGGDYDLHPQFTGGPGHHGNPLLLPRPRFDPLNPLPDAHIFPGSGRGPRDGRNSLFGPNFGPRFF